MGVEVVCSEREWECLFIIWFLCRENVSDCPISVTFFKLWLSSTIIILYLMEIYACMIRHTLYTHTHHFGNLFITLSPLCPGPSQECKCVPPSEYIYLFYSQNCLFSISRKIIFIIFMFLFILRASQRHSWVVLNIVRLKALYWWESHASL